MKITIGFIASIVIVTLAIVNSVVVIRLFDQLSTSNLYGLWATFTLLSDTAIFILMCVNVGSRLCDHWDDDIF